ncbi:MAG: flagellar hook-basal body protein [Oscillospiraceae bacterium]|nr:flagellar hook-basal body protein [Oscillospiraceae bacterium]
MLRGIYTAESGLLTAIRDINVKSNNLSNISTAGFKQDRLVTTTFAEALAVRQAVRTTGKLRELGTDAVRGKTALELKTDFSQGALQETHRSLDFAIAGEGFFTVESRGGEYDEYDNPGGTYEGKYYTRNGQFQLDPEGYLIDGLGNYVLDDGDSPIFAERYDFLSDEYGNLFTAEGDYIATLGIFNPRNPDLLIKSDEYPFVILDEATAMRENEDGEEELENLEFTGKIAQGFIERANTDIGTQMSGLISASRYFQSLTQIVRAIDAALGRSVTEVGRL